MKHATPSEKKLGIRIPAIVFIPAMVALLAINLLTGAPYWVHWELLSWSIGLFCHWFFVLGPGAGNAGTA